MTFQQTPLLGAWLIGLQPHVDERGIFARAFCAREFAHHGLAADCVQSNISVNRHFGTIRGLHFQRSPHQEIKMIRCLQGSVHDVIVDVRRHSPTYLKSFAVEISAANGLMLYIPEGFAHGYQALTNDASVYYMVSEYHSPAHEGGLRHDDPALALRWPLPVTQISAKDASWPLIDPSCPLL